MDSKLLLIFFLALGAIFFLIILFEEPKPSLALDSTTSIIFYWGDGCPHCQKVKNFIEENNLKTKITIIEKEVYKNKTNAQELLEVAKSCSLDTSTIGIPFLVYKNKCYIGSDQAIELLNSFLK
ncbi:MAG: hypothetical protein QXV83_01125 [Candidatus Anstonellaceae archaeon]